ncbi:hypothetical protein [Phenylobacterium sp.]|uniref:hypothetical protein n=1 Tax=Phenylobacterium sp. TaxID=1871053 RepID=UPI002735B31D|nr:hypothetical protein [Phenylobacterium sp.]MDP3853640.1 hypothetical protein [Phenylobacterium sp.]
MRQPHPQPVLRGMEARNAWREFAYQARIHGEWVGRGAVIEKFAAAGFVRLVSQTAKIPFPLEHVSAQAASRAFLTVAQAFITAVRDEDRDALAAFMAAGAICVDKILTDHAHAAAKVWRDRLPGDD